MKNHSSCQIFSNEWNKSCLYVYRIIITPLSRNSIFVRALNCFHLRKFYFCFIPSSSVWEILCCVHKRVLQKWLIFSDNKVFILVISNWSIGFLYQINIYIERERAQNSLAVDTEVLSLVNTEQFMVEEPLQVSSPNHS